ncbi:MAG: NAD(P)-dependent oxidoreductase [Polaromonas sp.]|uniref:NAD(P)-dependent oxidoreductase n=1 Tax=Polaromonas sp. TaxID=1869339 RepID=UPI0025DF9154|nr:NAD(P)-dependent oxidoreductase [Polaromonas sp.]MBI2725783.1 NAD(P)-dependent oxidoreductase [Polaromonas sp.]
MKIALIGATGFTGAPVLAELLSRGHQVTALARTPEKLQTQKGLNVVKADVLDEKQVAAAVAGHDAVISAYNPGWSEPKIHDIFLQGSHAILQGIKQAGVKRVLVIGGAGSLYVAPGVQLVDVPQFPAEYKQGALAARELLNRIEKESTLDWTFISPPIGLAPGERTGKYRVGANDLLPGKGDVPAGISVADLAVAIVDEIEKPQHIKKRFTAAN